MNKLELLKKLENIEANAHRLLNDAATLKEELSGGSDSSNSQALSSSQRQQLLSRRRKIALGNG